VSARDQKTFATRGPVGRQGKGEQKKKGRETKVRRNQESLSLRWGGQGCVCQVDWEPAAISGMIYNVERGWGSVSGEGRGPAL